VLQIEWISMSCFHRPGSLCWARLNVLFHSILVALREPPGPGERWCGIDRIGWSDGSGNSQGSGRLCLRSAHGRSSRPLFSLKNPDPDRKIEEAETLEHPSTILWGTCEGEFLWGTCQRLCETLEKVVVEMVRAIVKSVGQHEPGKWAVDQVSPFTSFFARLRLSPKPMAPSVMGYE
jgi:hypothetical protein